MTLIGILLGKMECKAMHIGILAFLIVLVSVDTSYARFDHAVKERVKRQIGFPGLFSIPGFGGSPILGTLADNRKCCCKYGMPPECLPKCVIRPGANVVTPPYCDQYSQIYAFTCFAAPDEEKGECSPDYIQPPPRPGNCPALLLQSDDILCNSDSCHTDHSCVNRPTSKCCRTTCPDRLGGSMTGKTICLEGVMGNLSRCELHRHRVLDQLIEADVLVNRSSLKAWLPECTRRQADPTDPNGASYKSTQCIPGAKTCFCVNETSGEELDSSRYTQGGTPINCTLLTSKQYSPCRVEALLILEQHASLSMPELMHKVEQESVWIPSCVHNSPVGGNQRSHRHLQCDTRSGFCWCTTHGGKAILDAIMPIGHSLFTNECVNYNPTRCEREVAVSVHDYRLAVFGRRNGTQHFRQRKFYESVPNFFVHRCAKHGVNLTQSMANEPAHSYEEVQFTLRGISRLSERFCVDTKTGYEVEGSRLGSGEHRYVRHTTSTKNLCLQRSHCEGVVFSRLRWLHEELLRRGSSGLRALVNRDMARSLGEFIPVCRAPSVADIERVKPGQPLLANSKYGYAPRQCGALNQTCWCVYRDGVAVPGTVHNTSHALDCTTYHSLCIIPGRVRLQAPTPALRAAMRQCPTGQMCHDVGLHIGIGLCQAETFAEANSCKLNGKGVLHGASTLVQATCQLCQCRNGRLSPCHQLPKKTCASAQPCFVRAESGRVISLGHGMRSSVDCGDCECLNGMVKCTKRNCSLPEITPQVAKSCLQPADEGDIGRVCAPNGRTYSSQSAAMRCAGFEAKELITGPCPLVDPCRPGVCMDGLKCVPSPRQCLVSPCPQHLCVVANTSCDTDTKPDSMGPGVCFSGDVSHSSLCHGIVLNKHVQYLGACDQQCSGLVCGSDKVTYQSRCHAHASNMPVDYAGPCRKSCAGVQCPKLPSGCTVVTSLPDECCPYCGGGAQVSISKPIAASLSSFGHAAGNDVTSILMALQNELKGASALHCTVRGHVTSDDVIEVRLETVAGHEGNGLSCFQGVQSLMSSVNTGTLQQHNAITAALTTANVEMARTGFPSSAGVLSCNCVVILLSALLAMLLI